jgi:hypothetical protein
MIVNPLSWSFLTSTKTCPSCSCDTAVSDREKYREYVHNSSSGTELRYIQLMSHLIYKIEIVGMYVCSLIARERMNQFAPKLACLFLETRKRCQEGQNSEKYPGFEFR